MISTWVCPEKWILIFIAIRKKDNSVAKSVLCLAILLTLKQQQAGYLDRLYKKNDFLRLFPCEQAVFSSFIHENCVREPLLL